MSLISHLYFSLYAELSTAGRTQFISTLKSSIKSPLASNVVLGLILAGLEKLVELEFACPCKPTLNAVFASAYFILPGVTVFVLMLCIQGRKCKTSQERENLVFYGVVPIITWLILMFLDGQYYACAKTNWSGRFVIVDKAAPEKWCEPDNTTLSVERMSQTQQWYFQSQVRNNLISLKLFIVHLPQTEL